MKKIYPSKAKKRKAEYILRKIKRYNKPIRYPNYEETIEEMANRLGIRLD